MCSVRGQSASLELVAPSSRIAFVILTAQAALKVHGSTCIKKSVGVMYRATAFDSTEDSECLGSRKMASDLPQLKRNGLPNPKTQMIASDLLQLTVDFSDEFYLVIVSDVHGMSGKGWHPSGTIANLAAPTVARPRWRSLILVFVLMSSLIFWVVALRK